MSHKILLDIRNQSINQSINQLVLFITLKSARTHWGNLQRSYRPKSCIFTERKGKGGKKPPIFCRDVHEAFLVETEARPRP